jgi:hypothetical protein
MADIIIPPIGSGGKPVHTTLRNGFLKLRSAGRGAGGSADAGGAQGDLVEVDVALVIQLSDVTVFSGVRCLTFSERLDTSCVSN